MSNLRLPGLLRRALCGAALLFLFTGAHAQITEPTPIAGNRYTLTKNWTFGVNINTVQQMREEFFTRYVYANGNLDTLNDEWQVYRDNSNHVITPAGLDLVARVPTTMTRGKIESGMLRSKWTGKYGYFEARVKVPKGRGMWPAFWLNPQDGKWPPEIDIMEIVNNGRDTPKNGFHILHSGDRKSYPADFKLVDRWGSYWPGFDYSDDFHTFAVLWEANRVRHYVDGKLVLDQRFDWLHSDGTDGGPAHILLNLAVGGSWPGAPTSLADFPARMSVQFVRVWQKQP